MLDRVKDEIALFPLLKESALLFQVAGVCLMLVAGVAGPIDKVLVTDRVVGDGLG